MIYKPEGAEEEHAYAMYEEDRQREEEMQYHAALSAEIAAALDEQWREYWAAYEEAYAENERRDAALAATELREESK